MKEIVIISGKGGTGKTSLTAAFASLASKKYKTVYADCDVDAADLHLLFSPTVMERNTFVSGHYAVIDREKCVSCGKCGTLCKYDAVVHSEESGYSIDVSSCEGCGVCVHFCPVSAIEFPDRLCGEWYISSTRFGTLVHAQLDAQAENSGKLVSLVRQAAKKMAETEGADLIITDGPPGIGCPVIASITGAHAVIAVTEPSKSGKHDLERIAELAKHFRIPLYVCVNRWDINPCTTASIEKMCAAYNAVFIGKLKYDRSVNLAQIRGLSLIEYIDNKTTKDMERIWKKLYAQMTKKTKSSSFLSAWRRFLTR